MEKIAEEIMTRNVTSVTPEQSILEALRIMKKIDVRHLPVVDKKSKHVIGLLSEGDIVLHSQKIEGNLAVDSEIQVKEAMTKDIIYCYRTSNAADIAATMITAKIDSVPVLNSITNQLEGIITTTDLLDLICMEEELDGHVVHPFRIGKQPSRFQRTMG